VSAQGGGVVLYMRSDSGELQDSDGSSNGSSSHTSILAQCQALHQLQQQEGHGASSAAGVDGQEFEFKAYGLAAQVRGGGWPLQ